MREHHYRLYGALSLLVIVGLIVLCLASFQRAFTPTATVTVHISRAGQQLLPGSDVKIRGIDVGEVDSITSDGTGADLHLHMQPGRLKEIPANVTVRLVPKTLFGEKYVDLVLPAQPTAAHLVDGSVIAEDRTKPALEIDQALDDLLPLLRAVKPVKLDETLSAVATALQGRGNELGQTIDQFDTYLKGLNPQLPTLHHDVVALSGVARTYNEAADPLLHMLSNLTVTANTIVDERLELTRLLADVTGAAVTTRQLLALNASNIVAVNRVNRPVISLLARYSPEFPCFFRGDAGLVPRIHDAVPKTPGLNHAAHVVVEFVPSFPIYHYPIDLPEFQDTRGPNCYGLPHPKLSLPVVHYKDGTQDDPRFDNQGKAVKLTPSTSASTLSMGNSGTAAEKSGFNSVLGPVLGMPPASVPDIADLLWGPMARGNTVRLR